nr:homocysteine S-methyltransferase family protein [Solirubrobacterales bacterium]
MTLTRTQVGSPDSLVVDSSRDGRPGAAYARIDQQFAARRCVILDGGMATELGRILPADERRRDEALWGPWALLHAPDAVRDVHSHYLDIGCDVISTNTWGLSGATDEQRAGFTLPVHWMDLARRGIHLGREAIATSGRGEVALAFSINGDVSSEARLETLRLLPRIFEEDPPDLILLETMTLVRDNLTDALVAALVAGDIPVWVSFRRCRHGVCGVYGQHWGGPEGDDFGRAARRFEELGARALLINCLPPDHVPGMLPWLRDFTDLPLGVYPNLGYYTEEGWSFDQAVGGAQYAELAAQWRAEGADIIGGCCGVRPEHI